MSWSLAECFDFGPICRCALDEWPLSSRTPLLETRFNELTGRVFNADKRIRNVCFGLYKTQAIPNAKFVGLERELTRRQFEEQQRTHMSLAAIAAAKRKPARSEADPGSRKRTPAIHQTAV